MHASRGGVFTLVIRHLPRRRDCNRSGSHALVPMLSIEKRIPDCGHSSSIGIGAVNRRLLVGLHLRQLAHAKDPETSHPNRAATRKTKKRSLARISLRDARRPGLV